MKFETNNEIEKSVYTADLNEPPLYQVLIHNDDFTPMEFVVDLLERFFFMERRKAIRVAYEAHQVGKAICGVFSKDVASTKVTQVSDRARDQEHPLVCSMEAA